MNRHSLAVWVGIITGLVCSPALATITNTRTGQTYLMLQDAVDAATPGDTIEIDGTLIGDPAFALIQKSLTVRAPARRGPCWTPT